MYEFQDQRKIKYICGGVFFQCSQSIGVVENVKNLWHKVKIVVKMNAKASSIRIG